MRVNNKVRIPCRLDGRAPAAPHLGQQIPDDACILGMETITNPIRFCMRPGVATTFEPVRCRRHSVPPTADKTVRSVAGLILAGLTAKAGFR